MGQVVTVVTSNPHKYREIRAILAEHGIDSRWVPRELPEPQADTLRAVVREKLASIHDIPGVALVEDSGLFIPALEGFPGVYSAYALRTIGLDGILRLLRGRSREACFRTLAAVRWGAREWVVSGEVDGRIAGRPRGRGGFGYDPVFIPAGERRTFAEMSPSEKDAFSHRGRAIRAVARRIQRATRSTPGSARGPR
jgi:XTP/dITP diphosphohydrolase